MRKLDPGDNVDHVRLLTGDTDPDNQYLESSTISWFLDQNSDDPYEAAVECLEVIINIVSLTPERYRIGDAEEYRTSISTLERRLEALKAKRNRVKKTPVPVIIRTDREDWSDFDKIFGGN